MQLAEYPTYCAPRAVAALLDLTPREAALAIRTAASSYGRPEPVDATPHLDMIRAVMALGREVQSYRPDGSMHARAGRYRIMMMAPDPEPVDLDAEPEAIRAAVLAERRRIVEDAPSAAEPTPPLIVTEWLKRYPWGSWLLTLRAHAGRDAHVLAVREGHVIEGGHSYYSAPVATADRILDKSTPRHRRRPGRLW